MNLMNILGNCVGAFIGVTAGEFVVHYAKQRVAKKRIEEEKRAMGRRAGW